MSVPSRHGARCSEFTERSADSEKQTHVHALTNTHTQNDKEQTQIAPLNPGKSKQFLSFLYSSMQMLTEFKPGMFAFCVSACGCRRRCMDSGVHDGYFRSHRLFSHRNIDLGICR